MSTTKRRSSISFLFGHPLCVCVWVLLQYLAGAHIFHVDHTDQEIRAMDIETLLHVESDLRKQNGVVDQHVTGLRQQLKALQDKQRILEMRSKKVESAKDWEFRQRMLRTREVERAKAEIESKRLQIELLHSHEHKLYDSIREMEQKLQSSHRNRMLLEEQFEHPSLQDILVNEAAQVGPLPEHFVNKTVDNLVPQLRRGLIIASVLRDGINRAFSASVFFTSFCLYVLGIGSLVVTYRSFKLVKKIFTLPRALFIVDMLFGSLWVLVLFCYGATLEDPFNRLATRHASLSIIVQTLIIGLLAGNVGLRCLALSATLDISYFNELFCVLFVFQCYFQTVWFPLAMDKHMKSSWIAYSTYLVIHVALAIYRARSIKKEVRASDNESDKKEKGSHWREWLDIDFERYWHYWEDVLTTGFDAAKQYWELSGGSRRTERREPRENRRAPRSRNVYTRYVRKQRAGNPV